MFDLGKLDDPERLAKPTQCEAKLAGILTEYRPQNKAIVVTSVGPVLDVCQCPAHNKGHLTEVLHQIARPCTS